ncbi:MAG: DapH/DapD/GlmU-related protein [Chloroflexota bacterium]|nr:DapH/DapD/GlmU-related protein [Chloroflexota bacterium]
MKPPSIFNLFKKILQINLSKPSHIKKLISSGVKIQDENSVFIEDTVEISPGTIILPSTYITGKTKIQSDCVIGPNTTISDSTVGKDSKIIFSIVSDSFLGEKNQIGPFAYIRESTITDSEVILGNFVEVKSSKIGKKSKSKHLSYIGDSVIEKNVNIGAGFVMANFDGKSKNKSLIKENVFVGSNTTIISPVIIHSDSIIGAGSVVTKDVLSAEVVVGNPARKLRK